MQDVGGNVAHEVSMSLEQSVTTNGDQRFAAMTTGVINNNPSLT